MKSTNECPLLSTVIHFLFVGGTIKHSSGCHVISGEGAVHVAAANAELCILVKNVSLVLRLAPTLKHIILCINDGEQRIVVCENVDVVFERIDVSSSFEG